MSETYRKIDSETLEITSNHTYLIKKEHIEDEKQMAKVEKERIEKRIEKAEAKLDILKE